MAKDLPTRGGTRGIRRGQLRIDDLQPRIIGIEPHHPHEWRDHGKRAGSAAANLESGGHHHPSGGRSDRLGTQAVIIKCEIVTHGRSAVQSLHKHARYLERDGDERAIAIGDTNYMSRRGQQGLFGPGDVENWSADRHHYRLIVSPERGDRLDMHQYVHDLCARIQKDQGRAIHWRAVVHRDTDNVHAHILLRGRDERGRYVSIPIDYLYNQLRQVAIELATARLGGRSAADIDYARGHQAHARYFTQLDRELTGRCWRREELGDAARTRLDWLVAQGHAEYHGMGLYKVRSDLEVRLPRHDRTRSRISHEQQSRQARALSREPRLARDLDLDP